MSSRQLYEAILIELNKENAPNILLEDFNYLANKAINQYVNKRYNIYDVNQQTTDDLRVLKATTVLNPIRTNEYDDLSLVHDLNNNGMATYYVDLPSDYLHILNCICIYKVNKTYKCYNKDDTWRVAATRLTSDAYSLVLDNFWLKPSYKRPYYYIHNVNTTDFNLNEEKKYNPIIFDINDIPESLSLSESELVIINPEQEQLSGEEIWENVTEEIRRRIISYEYEPSEDFYTLGKYYKYANYEYDAPSDTDMSSYPNRELVSTEYVLPKSGTSFGTDYVGEGDFPRTIKIGQKEFNSVEREAKVRYGNTSKVRLEIRYGSDTSVFLLSKVLIDYLKTPLHIRLTQEELDYTEDKSQMLEFPDYVCQEIINELVHIVMERNSDQRLQTHPVVSLSIANPAQALAPAAAG